MFLEAEYLEAEYLEAELLAAQEEASHKGPSPTSAKSPPELQLVLDARFSLARAAISLAWRRQVGPIGRR